MGRGDGERMGGGGGGQICVFKNLITSRCASLNLNKMGISD